ncbi:molybdenum cofactor biosynthesis protein MoaE [Paenibacillus sp. PL2-23]|uniref:molybdenum cofactor biosynthesis protein n=1 Tax=Paenibacillus sp. PL2-23 TaxID=2100729 RepID=UPI0030F87247
MTYEWKIKLFAGLQERLGKAELTLQNDRGLMTVRELKEGLAAAFPEHASLIMISFAARNHVYSSDQQELRAEDELALLPPVSGGETEEEATTEQEERYVITSQPISVEAVTRKVIVKEHGASIAFVGTTREWTEGQRTVHLAYEAYEPMALAMMRQIGDEIDARWPGTLCAITHRIGVVELAETSVVIAVSSPHRDSCYDASRYAIERLKQIVPIWKKEIWADGSEWKGHQKGPWDPTASLE